MSAETLTYMEMAMGVLMGQYISLQHLVSDRALFVLQQFC